MYISTRGDKEKLSAANAIKNGIALDGGLFVPESIPKLSEQQLLALVDMNYGQRAFAILEKFLEDYQKDEIKASICAAYNESKFDNPDIAPLVTVGEDRHVLELWHGPTSAFKDMALQLLPQLLSRALKKTGEKKEVVILVATSGDTGKAALEGFKDIEQIKIIVFYPREGVSKIQRLQMVSQEGQNVAVVSVQGNFDDAQTGVKKIFNDNIINFRLQEQGFQLSSANSINWGRLVPQIVYYFSAYADMVKGGKIAQGGAVNFVVPTGNFGNILAGYYAKLMGLPIHKLICASNSNNVLTDFLHTGIYNRNRGFHKTLSPSMDILISSNLERLLYHVTGGNTAQVKAWMEELQNSGTYNIGNDYLSQLQEIFWADWANDEETVAVIKDVFSRYHYLADPHTAVAWHVYNSYRRQTGDYTPAVLVSTASPFKFNESVLLAIDNSIRNENQSEFAMLHSLADRTGWPVPNALADLAHKEILHKINCSKEEMPAVLMEILKID
ncbi:hypothetical protein P22_3115 [Propionispora sp. 2/2-37]|uniref:threonine synthase n=1 Tax=Propionispora sp. 2/2-37 TaxID=1677858 RepID=UPI0006BB5D6F|nr:threonine synthase [Propionispora sp. 2/2-37]CUH96989.1 hypothetical protein P22_3115 [Propionispora sp. 2/2-37]